MVKISKQKVTDVHQHNNKRILYCIGSISATAMSYFLDRHYTTVCQSQAKRLIFRQDSASDNRTRTAVVVAGPLDSIMQSGGPTAAS